MSRQGQLNIFSRAGVQDVEQHALVRFHADRLAEAQALSIDGEALIADLPAIRFFIFRRGRFSGAILGSLFVFLFLGGVKWLPFVRRQKDFLIVLSRVALGLNVYERELARIRAAA